MNEIICELAGKLYTKYNEAVGGVAFNGDALPTWDEFSKDPNKKKQCAAWLEVADEALCLAYDYNQCVGIKKNDGDEVSS